MIGAFPQQVGYLDLKEILSLLLDEIFGQLAAEKEDETVAGKMVETRNKKGINSIFFIAQSLKLPD